MNSVLPDVSRSESAPVMCPLEWVGMQGIDLPLNVVEPDCAPLAHAKADVQVNLPVEHIKGIHMSRLYLLLDALNEQALSPALLVNLLQEMLASHKDCQSDSVRLRLVFDLLARRPALLSPELSGWKSYPITLEATLDPNGFRIELETLVSYSSTCPCSAALSRNVLEAAFRKAFENEDTLELNDIAHWLNQNGSIATPHSQRSEARVKISLGSSDHKLAFVELINAIEDAVQTPLQTAVKRVDEQAFAELNGRNLMFVEDAARRIQARLNTSYANPRVHVRHLESLHQHDAAAWSRA
ncbi:GTP cyclohydrolase FolE2 [Pseudoteredinibacter isoporae]|uniref:GTP cyclohydrolase FolE2 n=1 Tax=Pseudoteredinibacter isoporae TaxID=570281 RepID=A0A7X0JU06_9GAMM|nr:GTP cyclohydrolase FolE2 [Pseudoteredinibacter isoporae]MBB6522238.1 GTP cyclohydrolase I [Pseudoteredinibacter isoporae]NHO87772.1 GTP cyclohydrolase I FolE2 [Pseudoteredinibacter isoporae]NIB23897.1 GTP cyclohydrolase I FolE2 [Pseudoteredinibacter isoporae]